MANLKEVRTRIASVSSTQQITSAMKMVSAAKFRRAQNAIVGMRPYAEQLGEIVADIDTGDGIGTPYHAKRVVQAVTLVVITSNKGLCGAFNSNVLKLAQQRIEHWRGEHTTIKLITIGKKASEMLARQKDLTLEAHDELLDAPTFDAVATLADSLLEDFVGKKTDHVEIIYNQFKNSLSQILTCEQFLPVEEKKTISERHISAGTWRPQPPVRTWKRPGNTWRCICQAARLTCWKCGKNPSHKSAEALTCMRGSWWTAPVWQWDWLFRRGRNWRRWRKAEQAAGCSDAA